MIQSFKDFLAKWEGRLLDVGHILDYLNSYPEANEIALKENLTSSAELFKIQEDWFCLHSKYKGVEKEFFKNYWVPLSPSSYDSFIDMSHPYFKVFSISFIPIEPYQYIIQDSFTSITELMFLLDSDIDVEEFNSILKEKRFKELESLLENRAKTNKM